MSRELFNDDPDVSISVIIGCTVLIVILIVVGVASGFFKEKEEPTCPVSMMSTYISSTR